VVAAKNRAPTVRILTIRDQKVVLDVDLARAYGVTTKRLNEQLRRNQKRFPPDFAFQITSEEFRVLRSQFATLDEGFAAEAGQRSQNAILRPGRGRYRKYRPWAFTEHGALQAANILRSDRAIAMSVYVIRAFIEQREKLAANAAILKRLAEIDKSLLEHDTALRDIYQKLLPLLAPPPEPPRRQIGFSAAP
jgi:ORF6N domain.